MGESNQCYANYRSSLSASGTPPNPALVPPLETCYQFYDRAVEILQEAKEIYRSNNFSPRVLRENNLPNVQDGRKDFTGPETKLLSDGFAEFYRIAKISTNEMIQATLEQQKIQGALRACLRWRV